MFPSGDVANGTNIGTRNIQVRTTGRSRTDPSDLERSGVQLFMYRILR